MSEDPCLVNLPQGEVIGLSFTAFAGFLSAFAVIFVLILVARNYMRNVRNPPPGGEWKLIRTHVDAYLLSLLGSDLMQSLGAILDIKWAAERKVYCSPTCTAQGVIQVIGETGVAMATFAIALHTFLVIFFRWSPSPRHAWIWKVVIAFIWMYVSIYAIAGYAAHHKEADNHADLDAFYTPTPYWCWISGEFDAERITAEYLWLWIAAFASIILYTFLFFRVRGNITVDPQNWRHIRFKLHRWTASDGADATTGAGNAYFDGAGRGARGGEAGKTAAREAMSMIWYPVTYTILVLPLSIVRWSTFRAKGQTEPAVPFPLTSVVVTIFGLSGIANVVLILLTRKNLLLFGQRGVVNPAKIGLAATGRLPRQNGDAPGGGGGGGAGPGRLGGGQTEKRRFHFHNLVHPKQAAAAAAGKHAPAPAGAGDVSTDDTTTGERRSPLSPGNTSFAAGRFTTQAYETERSFDVGSTPMPFSPNTAGTDTRDTMMSIKGPRYYLGEDGGIPEGMSYDLGSRGEYNEEDAAALRHLSVPVMGTIPIGMLGPDGALHAVSSGQTTQADVSNPSNFLEMKDSRSNPGPQEQEHDIPFYPPPPRVPPPPQQQPTYPDGRRPSATYSEGRRPSAGTLKTAEGSRPNSAKSKAGSSIHGRKSGDISDYSFNPTPPPPPPPPPPETSDSRVPYSSKSRNGSSKSLGKSSSITNTPPKPSTSTWSHLTSMFSSKRDGDDEEIAAGPSYTHPERPPGLGFHPEPPMKPRHSSPFDDYAPGARAGSNEALELARTRTGSYSRASTSRRNMHASEEDTAYLRPSTAGSNRSQTSYTFGVPPPGSTTRSRSSTSLRNKAEGTNTAVEMHERPRQGALYPPPSPQSIGRAL